MRRLISLLLALGLLLAVCVNTAAETAETEAAEAAAEATETADGEEAGETAEDADDGDDSIQIPVNIPEEADEAAGSSVLELRPLQTGDEGDDVLFLQLRLQNLGYFTGEADGKYGNSTAEAVKTFQIDYRTRGLEVTGQADTATQLLAVSAKYRALRKGSSGEDVKVFQERLAELGFYSGNITGNFLEGSRNGITQFQKYNGMEQTGVADIDTLEVFYSDNAVGRYDEDDTMQPSPTPNMDQYYLVDESENGVPMPDEPVVFTKELRNGVKNASEQVLALQKRMAELGYYDGPVSGNFLGNTQKAVKAIQKQNGMKDTGVVDEETWNVIFNNPGLVMPHQTPKPTPKPKYFIVVDVNNQIVTVWGLDEENEYRVPVRYMLCSSGNRSTPTPVGRHVLNGRKTNWCYFPKWGDWARYWTRINPQVAFHSPIHREADSSTLKENTYKMLGNRASHGCVRLSVQDAKWVFDNTEAGMVVWVREDMEANQELKDSLKAEKPPTSKSAKPDPTPPPAYSVDDRPQIKGTIAKGSRDTATVYWIQRRLQELGYYTTRCTGTFKNKTDNAVKAFQADHGMARSGYVSQELIDLMAEEQTAVWVAPADSNESR